MVGCVIVHDNKIIGEGWHKKFGEAHAEVNAVNSVINKEYLKESTVYVTLEPCSHFGKTPPCADMLIREKVKKVIIANTDSNPLVAGKGITKLKNAGIDVVAGLLESEGRKLNARFFTFVEERRPYIILKWAQTADGFIARENYDSKWISDEFSRQVVHKWRAEEDAILVGSGTAQYDNPKLNTRNWIGRDPVRIVLDRNGKLAKTLNVFDQSQQTIAYNIKKNEAVEHLEIVKVREDQFIPDVLADLYNRKLQSVIVEGGGEILNVFYNLGFWDEARVFVSPTVFGKGIPAPVIKEKTYSDEKLKSDTLKIFLNAKMYF
jgi:diaminohydroxyphosphoribosylaminopyrimidine deaminase/5-amino-6-(5-phosphoribosylamino)uracil reductase